MKRALILILMIYAVSGSGDEVKLNQPAPTDVIHVATALDHLTVLEFGEPVLASPLSHPRYGLFGYPRFESPLLPPGRIVIYGV